MSESTAAPGESSWRISRTCDSGACIGVARRDGMVVIGNTNDPEGQVGKFSVEEWRQFVAGVKLGDFDDIAR